MRLTTTRRTATPIAAAVVCAALLLTTGCSGSTSHQADSNSPTAQSPTPGAQSSAQAPKGKQPGEPTPPGPGTVKIRYEDATTPAAQRGRQLMQDAKVLEDLAAHIGDTLALPSDLGVVGKQCDADNDFYLPDANEIQLCYEAREHAEQLAAGSGIADPATPAVDETISAAYHELGHATLAIYQLAFTGREEDVADQLSAFMLLNPGADGKPYPDGVRIATNTALEWKLSAKEAGDANELPFWDGHSMDITRMYNWECWIYGSNPEANASIVSSGDLPEGRAGNCEEEFQNMQRGWQSLLGPHLRKPS